MWYIKSEPNEGGGYSNPQSIKIPGLVELPEEHLETFINYNGFVVLTIEGDKVTGITPNVEAWEEWKASLPEVTEPEEDNSPVTWSELDEAYNEGRDTAYDS